MPNTQLPHISTKEKDKAYHRKWAEAIISTSFSGGWSTDYNKLSMLYNFYKHGTGSDLTGYLQTAPDGSVMPGIWTSQNTVHTRVKGLIGELEDRGYIIKARALNSEAVARKYEERERLRIERHLQGVAEYAESLTGMPLQSGEYIPQTDQELDEYMDLNWKDKHVQILEAALKWIARRSHWDQQRVELFVVLFIANMVVVRNEIIKSVPTPHRVHPLNFIYDTFATDARCSDATYFGEIIGYMPLAQAAEQYGLSMSEMEQCYQDYQSYL